MSTLVEKRPSGFQKVKNALSQAAAIQSKRLAGEWPEDSIHSRAHGLGDGSPKQSHSTKSSNGVKNIFSESARVNGKRMSGGWT